MTKKLSNDAKALNLVKKIFELTDNCNCTPCSECVFKKNPLKYREQFVELTGSHCPKNQLRIALQMVTGIDRRLYRSKK